jgi:hypothetical protein
VMLADDDVIMDTCTINRQATAGLTARCMLVLLGAACSHGGLQCSQMRLGALGR